MQDKKCMLGFSDGCIKHAAFLEKSKEWEYAKRDYLKAAELGDLTGAAKAAFIEVLLKKPDDAEKTLSQYEHLEYRTRSLKKKLGFDYIQLHVYLENTSNSDSWPISLEKIKKIVNNKKIRSTLVYCLDARVNEETNSEVNPINPGDLDRKWDDCNDNLDYREPLSSHYEDLAKERLNHV